MTVKINHTVHNPSGCWLWQGQVNAYGYGRVYVGKNANGNSTYKLAHRMYYEHFIGPIPAGMHLDHVKARGCKFTNCVNPAHLEPVTPSENSRRKTKDVCLNGHDMSKAAVIKDGKGGYRRRCLLCQREHNAKWRRKESA